MEWCWHPPAAARGPSLDVESTVVCGETPKGTYIRPAEHDPTEVFAAGMNIYLF
jgi:hypothetical protein